MSDYTEYPQVGYDGPYIGVPMCWDGGNLAIFESYSNNARHGVVPTTLGVNPPEVGNFTDTTTSDANYMYVTEFVRPGLVPLLTAWDRDLTVYPPDTPPIFVVVSVDENGLTEVSRQPFPSGSVTNSPGWLRAWAIWPDEPTFFAYGNSGTSYVQGWQATVGADGSLSAFTSVGTTTTWPKSGSNFYYNSPYRAVTDRWALGNPVSTFCLRIDRLNPLATVNVYSSLPGMTSGDNANSQTLMMDARAKPGHILSTRGPYVSPVFRNHVLDITMSDDGSTFTVVDDWTAPSGTAWVAAGWSSGGKAVAYCYGTDGSATGFYDIFGDDVEFPVTITPGIIQSGWVIPTNPAQSDPPFSGTWDAWLLGGYSTPFEMGVMTTTVSLPIGWYVG